MASKEAFATVSRLLLGKEYTDDPPFLEVWKREASERVKVGALSLKCKQKACKRHAKGMHFSRPQRNSWGLSL